MPAHNDEDEDLGIIPNRIKPLRKERAMTLEQLAERTGLSVGHLNNVENHKKGFTAASLKKIATALGVKPVELLDTANAWQDIPILGIVGTNGSVRAPESGGAKRKIRVPLALGDAIALLVEGQSLYPRYDDGTALICTKASADPAEAVGRECFVVLVDGLSLIRRVEKAGDDTFMLTAHNLPPMLHQEILACRPIILSLPSI